MVELVDLAAFGRRTRLLWHKVRWCCANSDCDMVSWTWDDPRIAGPRQSLSDRAARWATLQVGRFGRSVAEIADELGCAWHTISGAVVDYGEALLDADIERVGSPVALRLDETLFNRIGPFRTQQWATSIVDVGEAHKRRTGKPP